VLQAADIPQLFAALLGHEFYPIAVLALGTGMRRGELLALRWQDVDLDGGSLKVERSLEETSNGLRFKPPKSARGRRTISSLNQFLDTWERDWMVTKVSPKTAERYSELLRIHVRPALGDKRMQAIRAEDLNRLYAQLHGKIAPRTVKHVHRLLHRIFGHAYKWRAIKHNVIALVDSPKVPPTEAAVLQAADIWFSDFRSCST
jgi:integrase